MIGVVKGLTREEVFTVESSFSDSIEITGAFGEGLIVSVLTVVELLDIKGIKVHFSGMPKDGLSAGLPIWASIYSLMNGVDFGDVAMTGRIDERGDVLRVGGIEGKLSHGGVVYLPEGNRDDVASGTAYFVDNVKDLEAT